MSWKSSFFFKRRLLISSALLLFIIIIFLSISNSLKKESFKSNIDMHISEIYFPNIIYARYYDVYNNTMFLTFPLLYQTTLYVTNLQDPLAYFASPGKTLLMIEGKEGKYRKKDRFLDFYESIDIFSSEGYHIRTDSVQVDAGNGRAYGHSPVTGYSLFGTMTGEGFYIFDRGCTIIFTGQSQLVLYPLVSFDKNILR